MLMFRPLMRYADFKGRASRTEYWLFGIVQTVFYLICVVMAAMSVANSGGGGIGPALLGVVGWLGLALLAVLILALPNYALVARRLHDIGLSAFWMALLLPAVAAQFATFRAMGDVIRHAPVAGLQAAANGVAPLEQAMAAQFGAAGALTLIAGLCNAVLFVMMLMPGKPGPNRFGPDPRDPDATAPETGLDGDRWDALIAEAKRGQSDAPGNPVFDFGPGPVAQEPPRQPQWANPAWDPGIAPSRPFGRRAD